MSKEVSKHDKIGKENKDLVLRTLDDLIAYCNGVTNKVTKHIDIQLTSKQLDDVKKLLNKNVSPFAENIVTCLKDAPLSRKEILEMLKMSNQTKNKERHIDPLMNCGWIAYTIPDNTNDRNQKYKLTEAGQRLEQMTNSSN